MTAALQSRSVSKRKSRRPSDATFVAVGSAIYQYQMDAASKELSKVLVACCPNEATAKSLVARLRAGEFSRAALRSHDSHMAARHGDLSSKTVDINEAANWRRVRASIDAFKRIDAQ